VFERNTNGVKVRADGGGDGWANAHRHNLPHNIYFNDLDCVFGFCAFGHNTANALFYEYVPDAYRNRKSAIRRFGYVALFDRKKTMDAAFNCTDPHAKVSLASYLHMCRVLSGAQPVPARFFYVVGANTPPWDMVEIDTQSGERTGGDVVIGQNTAVEWNTVWGVLGLLEAREQLRVWAEQ
jgi:hypothetical protein